MLEVGGGGGVASCAGQGREGAHRGFVAMEGEPPSDAGKDVAPMGVRAAPTGAEQDTTQDSEGQPKAKLEAGMCGTIGNITKELYKPDLGQLFFSEF